MPEKNRFLFFYLGLLIWNKNPFDGFHKKLLAAVICGNFKDLVKDAFSFYVIVF
ncbi:hypothetical protein THIOSC15_2240010 [uncultured Thiomicrorhabdus sp.]|jgi:hypothetical protein